MGKIRLTANENTVVVIGLPASGKTHLTNEISAQYSSRGYNIIHTDDFMKHGFDNSLYVMMSHLKNDTSERKIIEGVQGYRLLRKGLEQKTFIPDVVIVVVASKSDRTERYKNRNKSLNAGFDKSLETIWNDYLALIKSSDSKAPRFIIVNGDGGNNKHA